MVNLFSELVTYTNCTLTTYSETEMTTTATEFVHPIQIVSSAIQKVVEVVQLVLLLLLLQALLQEIQNESSFHHYHY